LDNFNVAFSITSNQAVDLVLLYLEQNPKVSYHELNVVFIRNIVREMLNKYGESIFRQELPSHVLLKRQDLLAATKGMFDL
jgi:hypothetical protein